MRLTTFREILVKMMARLTLCLVASLLLLSTTGCATYRTISEAQSGTAKVFSGTRLDARAIKGDAIQTKKFIATPPSYPAIDLPFSLVTDILILPLTVSAALYEYIFE